MQCFDLPSPWTKRKINDHVEIELRKYNRKFITSDQKCESCDTHYNPDDNKTDLFDVQVYKNEIVSIMGCSTLCRTCAKNIFEMYIDY